VDVAYDIKQVCFRFYRFAFEATVEQWAATFVDSIEVTGIAGLEAVHESAELRVSDADEQVKMVVHQTPGEQCPVVLVEKCAKSFHEEGTVVVILKDYLLGGSTVDYMI
jgi:hypothetical protein